MERYVSNELKKLDVEIGKRIFAITKEKKIKFHPSPLQAKIIKYLVENEGKEIYQKDLEEVFEVSKATISGVLLTMEKNKTIKRIPSKTDARQKKIVLPEKSKEIYNEVKETFKTLNEDLVKNISKDELNSFYKTIRKMRNNIKNNKGGKAVYDKKIDEINKRI